MRKIVVTFGLISGAVSSLIMIALVTFGDRIGFDRGAVIGNTSIVLSFLMVFFGIRTYRDNIGNGQITFLKGFTVGISITLISCVCYVVTWEVIYYSFLPDFWDKYGAHLVEKLRASGASDAAVQAKLEELTKYKELYKNPLINGALTFIEPFPIGLVITLISALVLRRKPQPQPEQSPLPAS
jgi:amino acid transporter